jgi:predicted GNAT superfamily acetyltransferase
LRQKVSHDIREGDALNATTPKIELRNAAPEDFARICALNLEAVEHTSAMDSKRLAELDALSCYHKVVCVDGSVSGFLLAMDNESAYSNVNFGWFAKKYPRFLYIDRVVIDPCARGLSLGTRLYSDVFDSARLRGYPVVVCEYNLVPANEPSRLFHDKMGFKECGRQWVAEGTKLVSLQVASV